jgi:predicted Zn-dependent protease
VRPERPAYLPSHYCHIDNRGATQTRIFREDDNYLFVLSKTEHYLYQSIRIEAHTNAHRNVHRTKDRTGEEGGLLGKGKLIEIAERVLELSGADQTEVLIIGSDAHLTRFANSTIHQNVSDRNVTVRLRAVYGRKVGVASGNALSEEALRKVVASAERVARYQSDNPDFRSLPAPQPVREVDAYVEATATCSPETRAQGVAAICALSRENALTAAGAFSTSVEEILVANSLGVSAYHCSTLANLMSVIMGADSSGYASATSMDVSQLDPEAVGRTAVDKALRSRHPTEIEPGTYTVILEPAAVADMLGALAYTSLGALSVQEGRSCMSGRLGEVVTGRNITLWDDGYDRRGIAMPFDYEGVPKQRVSLIDEGVAASVVYDTYTAGREEGKASTGHSLPAPNTMGPIPTNLFMAPGGSSLEEMLASTKRGIWVTRFHYTNPYIDPVRTILTGMTRDGTFLIENGEVSRPIVNLRFTQSILEAFSRAELIGSELVLVSRGRFGTCVPALKLHGFAFTGITEF